MSKHLGFLLLCMVALGCGDDDDARQGSNDDARAQDGGGGDGSVGDIDGGKPDATVANDANTTPDANTEPSDAQGIAPADAGDAAPPPPAVTKSFVYVGGWDWSGNAYPFQAFTLDHATGGLAKIGNTYDFGANPSGIARNAAGDRLYITNEYEANDKAGITVAAVDGDDGTPTKIDRAANPTGAFVYSSVHPSGKYLFAADYNGGTVAVYPIEADGKLGEPSDRVQFARKNNDESAQSHGVGIHHGGKWIYVPNKALDSIAQLTFDAQSGKLTERKAIKSAGGPRHIALRGELAFVMHEGNSHLSSYSIDDKGDLHEVDDESALPSDVTDSRGAHVAVHPSGKYVYASNRGHNSIAVFDADGEGKLTRRTNTPSGGEDPWDFALDGEGKLLVLVNAGDQDGATGKLNVFKIGDDGALSPLGTPVGNLKTPTGVALIPAR